MDWDTVGDLQPTDPSAVEWSFNPEALFTSSAVAPSDSLLSVKRAETAPTILTELSAMLEDEIPQAELYRCSAEYHQLYYSQVPRDPRMAVPIKPKRQIQVGPSNHSGVVNTSAQLGKSSFTGDFVSHPRGSVAPMQFATHAIPPQQQQVVVVDQNGRMVLSPSLSPPNQGGQMYVVVQGQPGMQVVDVPRPASGMAMGQQGQRIVFLTQVQTPPSNFPGSLQFNAHGSLTPPNANSPPHFCAGSVGNSLSTSTPPGMTNAASSCPPSGAEVKSLLQEYLATKDNAQPWTIKQIVGHIVEFSRDQDGSRFVQKQLEGSSESVALVYSEVRPVAAELITDVFGNYVVQKLFDFATDEIKLSLVEVLRGSVLALATQTYGCRVLQKALESVPSKHMTFVPEELAGHVPECVFDQNANHVIQKCIERMASRCQFVADAFELELDRLGCHAYGCRVAQKLFEACMYDEVRVPVNPYAPTDLTKLLELVLDRAEALVLNQFGNYVVQHGMLNACSSIQRKFIEKLTPKLFELSQSKFGSNVAEKMIQVASEEERWGMINVLISPVASAGSELQPSLVCMMRDPFANYVVQRVLDRSTPQQQQTLVDVIRPFISTIVEGTYGRHLIQRIEKMGLLTAADKTAAASASGGATTGGNNKEQRERGAEGDSKRNKSKGNDKRTDNVNKGESSAKAQAPATSAGSALRGPPRSGDKEADGVRRPQKRKGEDRHSQVATHHNTLQPSPQPLGFTAAVPTPPVAVGGVPSLQQHFQSRTTNQPPPPVTYVTTTQTYAMYPTGAIPVDQHTSVYQASTQQYASVPQQQYQHRVTAPGNFQNQSNPTTQSSSSSSSSHYAQHSGFGPQQQQQQYNLPHQQQYVYASQQQQHHHQFEAQQRATNTYPSQFGAPSLQVHRDPSSAGPMEESLWRNLSGGRLPLGIAPPSPY